jgi:hypothetical protein
MDAFTDNTPVCEPRLAYATKDFPCSPRDYLTKRTSKRMDYAQGRVPGGSLAWSEHGDRLGGSSPQWDSAPPSTGQPHSFNSGL